MSMYYCPVCQSLMLIYSDQVLSAACPKCGRRWIFPQTGGIEPEGGTLLIPSQGVPQ